MNDSLRCGSGWDLLIGAVVRVSTLIFALICRADGMGMLLSNRAVGVGAWEFSGKGGEQEVEEEGCGGPGELVIIDNGCNGFCRIVEPSKAEESGSSRYSPSGGVSNLPTCSTEEDPSDVCGVGGC